MAKLNLPEAPPAKAKPGETRTQRERADAMCMLIADGKSLRAAAKLEGLSHSEFLHLVRDNADLRTLYETAREAGIEADISDLETEANRVMRGAQAMARKGLSASAYVSAFGQKANIVKWRAEKQVPKKYGARVELSGPGGGPMEFTEVRRTVVDPKA